MRVNTTARGRLDRRTFRNGFRLCFAALALLSAAGESVADADAKTGMVRVAVASLDNSTGRTSMDALGDGFADLLSVVFGRQQQLVVVEREELRRVMREQKLMGRMDADSRLVLGRILKADFVVVGSFTETGEGLHIVLHVVEVKSGAVVRSARAGGTVDDLLPVCNELKRKLFEGWIGQDTSSGPEEKNPLADLHYLRGIAHSQERNFDLAKADFARSLALAPHADAEFRLAECHMATGGWGHAWVVLHGFIRQFPTDPRIPEARRQLDACRERMTPWQKTLLLEGENDKAP